MEPTRTPLQKTELSARQSGDSCSAAAMTPQHLVPGTLAVAQLNALCGPEGLTALLSWKMDGIGQLGLTPLLQDTQTQVHIPKMPTCFT